MGSNNYNSILHPGSDISTLELQKRLAALERSDQEYAMRGGSAVTYDTNGRISSLSATYITAGTLDASVVNVTNINASNINTGSINGNLISASTINGSSIKATEIDTGHIKALAVTAAKIAADTITAAQIAAGAISTSELAAGAVTAAKIAAGTITANEIAANTITGDEISTSLLEVNQIWCNAAKFGGIPASPAYDVLVDDDIYVSDRVYVGGSSEYFQGSGSGNDLKAYFDDNFEFYKGGVIKGIVDDNIWTNGDLQANGSKPFLIPHPDGSDRVLRYTAQESPDVSLRIRGRSFVSDGAIVFPEHFKLVTEDAGLVTVNLTPIGDKKVYVVEATNAHLIVGGNSDAQFYYEVVAIRKGYLNALVELDPNDDSLNERDARQAQLTSKIKAKNEQAIKDIEAGNIKHAEKERLAKLRNELWGLTETTSNLTEL